MTKAYAMHAPPNFFLNHFGQPMQRTHSEQDRAQMNPHAKLPTMYTGASEVSGGGADGEGGCSGGEGGCGGKDGVGGGGGDGGGGDGGGGCEGGDGGDVGGVGGPLTA